MQYCSKKEIKEIKNFLDTHHIGYEIKEYADGSINIYVAQSFEYDARFSTEENKNFQKSLDV